MEEEYFFSGYCRSLDAGRMVTVETDTAQHCTADCAFPLCPYQDSCEIAKKIKECC